MKNLAYILLLFCFVQGFQAQNNSGYRIISSNLGSSGSSQNFSTSNGIYKVSQSIGQSSVIGTHSSNGYYLRQGYQQPATKIKVSTEGSENKLQAKVYPNPFSQNLSISFSKKLQKNITVIMYDVSGKIIYNQEYTPVKDIQIQLQNIASGAYFLKVISGNKHFNTKLIKI